MDCLHPALEPVLARTLGVPLFQEQLLRMAMIAAGFTGGEAEELRRAFGFKRSEKRMKEVEKKLQVGMEKNGIVPEVQEKIIRSITSFALYGFPESHAASFALLAYASAYLKCHYLAAFTAAMLNNQPMGFYHAATLVKDAQRHGLRVKPIDITRSDWLCTLEKAGEAEREFILRVGLRYVKGLRQEIAVEIVRQRAARPFTSIEDLKLRVPDVRKAELTTLAAIGALNFIAGYRQRQTAWHAPSRRALANRARRAPARPSLVERRAGTIAAAQEPRNLKAPQAMTRRQRENNPICRRVSAAADDHGRAADRRFSWHGNDGRSASDGLPSRGLKKAGHSLRDRASQASQRHDGARGRIGDCAAASRHGQGLRVSQHGR